MGKVSESYDDGYDDGYKSGFGDAIEKAKDKLASWKEYYSGNTYSDYPITDVVRDIETMIEEMEELTDRIDD